MSLRINTNVAALNSYNNLNANQAKLENSFQQLSSGLRINKAADDAAGLSIAQGLTSQINGLTQAVSNANDGINVAQIADGALGTTQDILQRMRGLVVKAANVGTQDSKSLGAIQQEINNLNTQLTNISEQTKFGQTNLLDGSYNKNFQVGANGGDSIRLDLSGANVESKNIANSGVDLTKLHISNGVAAKPSPGFSITTAGVPTYETGVFVATDLQAMFGSGGALTISAQDSDGKWHVSGTPTGGVAHELGTLSFDSNTGVFSAVDANGNALGSIDTARHDTTFTANQLTGSVQASTTGSTLAKALAAAGYSTTASTPTVITDNGDGTWGLSDGTLTGTLTKTDDGLYKIAKVGTGAADAYISTKAAATDAAGALANYSTADSASDLSQIGKAIDAISEARSQIGAVQNQLSYTVSNLQTAITNVTASRSNLTDADLAQQVTAMTQSQILTQAATSVLAQANSAPQAILKLLQ